MSSLELSRKHSLYSLLLDELAYRLITRIHGRAKARQGRVTPLFAPTTDPIGHRLISTGVFERTQIEAIDSLLEENCDVIDQLSNGLDTFLDIGANIGVYTTRYAPRFKRTLSIEPNPMTFDVLRSNIALAQSPNVSAICVGASDREDYLPLTLSDDGVMGWSSFEDVDETSCRTVRGPVKTVDQIVEELAPAATLSLVKIDVEGHEAKVLRGAMGTLKSHRPVVLYEQLSRKAGVECERLLRDAGYKRFVVFARRVNPLLPFARCPVTATEIDPGTIDESALICAY
jgi:FkbM family methyltransferase